VLEIKNVSKSYAGNKVLDNISLVFEPGKVHSLMGENGAGKSSLLKIIMGLEKPDIGQVFLNQTSLNGLTVNKLRELGIAMIHQELLLVPELTVAQNIFLGKEKSRWAWLKDKEVNEKAKEILEQLGLTLKPTAKLKTLSLAERQMVEIAKAIASNAKLILMDEPSSALAETEVEMLFKTIETLKKQGVSVIYISHKMNEIFKIADDISVLRDGKLVITDKAGNFTNSTVIQHMVGRELNQLYPPKEAIIGEQLVEIRGLSSDKKFENINFTINTGEILGIAGLAGAGRTEIARAIYGLDKNAKGEVYISTKKIKIKTVKDALKAGIAFVGEDRKAMGIVPELSIKHNLSLASMASFSNKNFIKEQLERIAAADCVSDLQIKAKNIDQKIKTLSGGNQQKVVLGKALFTNPKFLILDEPTRGIDVGAKLQIYTLIRKLSTQGMAILLISSELPEILGMCDKILVISKGKQTALLDIEEASQEKIMHYAVS
jgi:inositol transport system ATP-binding protein